MHAKMTPMNDEGENKKPSSSSSSGQKRAKSEENQRFNFRQHTLLIKDTAGCSIRVWDGRKQNFLYLSFHAPLGSCSDSEA